MPDQNAIREMFRPRPSSLTICHDIMRFRVREILLVASVYDAYIIEREGQLMEQIYGEYYQLNLSTAPRVTAVHSADEATTALRDRRYDMVIIMTGLDRRMPLELSEHIRSAVPELPVLLLFNNNSDIGMYAYTADELRHVDRVFVWNGDPAIFLAMIKSVEDLRNVAEDTRIAATRVILLVEDSVRYYSRYLPGLYRVLMQDMQKLIAGEDIDARFKILRMRARPKVLIATSWEEGSALYARYRDYILCVISDVEFPRGGKLEPAAGIELARLLRSQGEVPVLLQSTDEANAPKAQEAGARFINKNSKTLLKELHRFFEEELGFGSFVFRDAQGRKLIEARYMAEFEALIATIPDESILYHAARHNFSQWFMAKGEVATAIALRKLTIDQFSDGVAGIRRMLAAILAAKRGERTRESMANYSESLLAERFFFMRLASGSVGGKGRGLSFIEHVLHRAGLDSAVPGLNIRLPRTAIIGTDEFHLFVDGIGHQRVLQMGDADGVKSLFLRTPLSLSIRQRLRTLLGKVTGPLAVRSSGLFEDSLSQPFAGIYETYFLPNSHPDIEVRLRQLEDAIRLVFASVYSPLARSYFDSVQYEMEEEKMAVIVQELVGRRRGDRFYPHISGVAQSYNYYPFAKMKPDDGIALLAVGLGKAVVDGEQVFRFCPRYPKARNQSLKDMLTASQRYFYALDMQKGDVDLIDGEMATLVRPEIAEAEKDGVLDMCVSTYDGAQNMKKPGLHTMGPRIVDFSYILEYKQLPLAAAIQTTLDIMKHALGTPVEIEFAVDLDAADNGDPTLYLLQVKPLVRNAADHHIDPATLDRSNLFLYTTKGMGNGIIEDVTDIVYISPDRFDRVKTEAMAAEIAALNKALKGENRRYILIGPGRWGSSDRFLGVPVDWSAISQTRVIVEAGLTDFSIDASLGSHFFHNITSMNIGYFTVGAHSEEDRIDWDWLATLPLIAEKQFARHVRAEKPLVIRMDGQSGIACIAKPKD